MGMIQIASYVDKILKSGVFCGLDVPGLPKTHTWDGSV